MHLTKHRFARFGQTLDEKIPLCGSQAEVALKIRQRLVRVRHTKHIFDGFDEKLDSKDTFGQILAR